MSENDCNIASTADVSSSATVIQSHVGEHCMVGRNTRLCYSTLGDYSYISENSHVFSSVINKFSSISWNVSIGPANHDWRRATQHSMLFAPRFGMISSRMEMAYDQYGQEVHIGNDVWIGCGACIMRGVAVGDGAVIGAGAFVSKDVPPYAMVVGANRLLRYRFDQDVIDEFLDFAWWDYPYEVIRRNIAGLSTMPTSVDDVRRLRGMFEGEEHSDEQ